METVKSPMYSTVSEKNIAEVATGDISLPNTPIQSRSRWLLDGNRNTNTVLERLQRFPLTGLLYLFVSVLTTLASFAILIWLKLRRELVPTNGVWKFLQPNSLLSVTLSLNAACLHFALSEGLTIAWWFNAQRPGTTVAELHSIWASGTSTWAALLQSRYASRISLATLLVATLPINAFLLLGAVLTPVGSVVSHKQIPVPMVRELRPGYSGAFNGGSRDSPVISAWKNWGNWRQVFQQVKNIAGSEYARYAYLGAYDQCGDDDKTECIDVFWASEFTEMPSTKQLLSDYYSNDTKSLFTFKAVGTGFAMNCTNSLLPYDYLPTAETQTTSGPLFTTDIGWDYAYPNTLQLNMTWKENGECSGDLNVTTCQLNAAEIEYPVEMRLDVAGKYRGPYFSLPITTTWQGDKVVRHIPPYPDENFTSTSKNAKTRYGGIANFLSAWMYANITLESYYEGDSDPSAYLSIDGPLGNAISPAIWGDTDTRYDCNYDMRSGLSYNTYYQQMTQPGYKPYVEMGPLDNTAITNPVDLVLNQIRQAMFLASVYEGAGWWSYAYAYAIDAEGNFNRTGPKSEYIQTVDAQLTKVVPIYHIRWAFWIASTSLTYVIALFILSTYWGFWLLPRRSTMSPVDVSRVMGAPLHENAAQSQMDVTQLLRFVGGKNVGGHVHE